MDFEMPSGDLDDWLRELKPYQRNAVQILLKSLPPEDAARHWLTSSGHQNIIPFGGVPDSKPFWDNFNNELRRFICDDSAYIEERKVLMAEAPITKAVLISSMSAAIGAQIGLAATLLAPAVAVLLWTVAKIGKNAYCSQLPASNSTPTG